MLNLAKNKKRMVKHLVLNGGIGMELVSQFLDAANAYWTDKDGEIQQPKIMIYLSSHGGLSEGEAVITTAINLEPHRFVLIANGEISSSAFSLFFNCNCEKSIMPGTYGMYHLSRMTIEISQSGEGHKEEDRFVLKHFTKEAKDNLKWCESIGMNAKEIQTIASTQDQYFTTQRIKELIDSHREFKNEQSKN